MQRYFLKSNELVLTDEDFHHATKVMRLAVGDKVELVKQSEEVVVAKATQITDSFVNFEYQLTVESQVELPIAVTIASALSKKDKADWIVQKGTEMGASGFIFFNSDFSIAKWDQKKQAKKIERLQKIAKGAAEQSHRTVIPTISYVNKIDELFQQSYDIQIVAYEESAKQGEVSQLKKSFDLIEPNQNLIAVFGSEGGISEAEINKLSSVGYKKVGLGPRILRAETAPLYLLASLSFFSELS
ncbi:16S rRNA (uracil(1498)-N(3))-methyltransferase [Dellaglioa algida]|uniref:16S rRNA (uracil(1498)-N(3))-methyltransferase n=1 Tax=Dellaglioa algida TaxID=105612 RepID=UPI000BDC7D8A|nr:16S rRNA (uracil(1498)-N(3))-methyltransferase [Dellaglioa algida]MDK1718105.1 16S rRNA (uracil(1498)-N(3))-methyltransferase [Dellaglioa algida]MDK1729126.1 16S rRNA (uracil(1498)-N(3))-methyltransferase [Dellaglioa algida]MDK1741560.1 16S rRNA (uracil(1498)-N(3))-methyltransferase [Dellaglioa algida]SOB49687.1 methylase of U1498 in 16S rRNA [Dellaglioa algida]